MKIGIIHPDLNLKGGAEYVSLNFLKALEDHEIELITLTDPDRDELEKYFDIDLPDFGVRKAPLPYSIMGRTGESFNKVRNATVKKYAEKVSEEYDLVISTHNEIGFEGYQYIHFPDSVNETRLSETGEVSTNLIDGDESPIYRTYLEFYRRLLKPGEDEIGSNPTVCNSEFTARVFEEAFKSEPRVIEPPVSIEFEENQEWENRKAQFLSIGRITEKKKQLEAIEILKNVRESGNKPELVIAGKNDTEYAEKVKKRSRNLEWVNFEGEVTRDRIKELIQESKYGIHNLRGEHFGLAPAEMIKGGCLVFAPDFGGPAEFINREELLFGSKEDAVSRIERVLGNEELQENLLRQLEDVDFNSEEDFQQKIRDWIE